MRVRGNIRGVKAMEEPTPPLSVLFAAVPLIGHLNPLIAQAEELARRGARVAVASTSSAAAHLKERAPEIPFIDLGSPAREETERLERNWAEATLDPSFVRGSLRSVDALLSLWPVMFDGLARLFTQARYDVAVVDLFSAAGVCAAEAGEIPVVINNPDLLGAISVKVLPPADHLPFLFSGLSKGEVPRSQKLTGPVLRWFAAAFFDATGGRRLNTLRKSRGLPTIDVHERFRHRTILVNGAFGLEYERPLPPNIHMVGPMLNHRVETLPQDLDEWLSNGPPVVYVNLGTLAAPSDDQVARMAEAFVSDGFRLFWILRRDHAQLKLPAGGRVAPWGPPLLSVLAHPNVRAHVSHCGINSVYESLQAGVPIVGIPMFADQRDMAVRVRDAGAGVFIDKLAFTPGELRAAVRRVIDDPGYRDRVHSLRAVIESAGGVRRAADLILAAAPRPPSR